MKKLVFIFLFLFAISYSQNITGKWKIISYEDEKAFYNKENDSIYFKDLKSKEEAENFKNMSDILIFSLTYTFFDNSDFTMSNPNFANIKGKYKLVEEEVAQKNNDSESQLFYFKNEILYTKTELIDGFVEVGLKKIN